MSRVPNFHNQSEQLWKGCPDKNTDLRTSSAHISYQRSPVAYDWKETSRFPGSSLLMLAGERWMKLQVKHVFDRYVKFPLFRLSRPSADTSSLSSSSSESSGSLMSPKDSSLMTPFWRQIFTGQRGIILICVYLYLFKCWLIWLIDMAVQRHSIFTGWIVWLKNQGL